MKLLPLEPHDAQSGHPRQNLSCHASSGLPKPIGSKWVTQISEKSVCPAGRLDSGFIVAPNGCNIRAELAGNDRANQLSSLIACATLLLSEVVKCTLLILGIGRSKIKVRLRDK